jgi:putative tricarboxylic transport membrane protein
METIQYLLQGLSVAMQPMNLLFVTLGGILGTIIGMVPGLGPATGIAILIPITFGMDPTSAIITMSGVYYGAMYGGSRSSILINTPGDGAAVAATFDGYPMTKKWKSRISISNFCDCIIYWRYDCNNCNGLASITSCKIYN